MGYKTENVLAHPLRNQRGGGKIIGVIEMINKPGGFDESDEEMLSKCVQKVADDLCIRFQELLFAAEKFAGFALFVPEKNGSINSARKGHDAPTTASIAGRYISDDSKDSK